MKKHTEARLEDAIIDHLATQGDYVFVDYREGAAKDRYDKARALDPALVLGFIQTTQQKVWQSLEAIHGAEAGISGPRSEVGGAFVGWWCELRRSDLFIVSRPKKDQAAEPRPGCSAMNRSQRAPKFVAADMALLGSLVHFSRRQLQTGRASGAHKIRPRRVNSENYRRALG